MPAPSGLASQFDTYVGGNPSGCEIDTPLAPPPPAPPSFIAGDGVIGQTIFLCGAGFDPALPVSVTVVDPEGTARTREVRFVSRFEVGWSTDFFPEPRSPTGEYRVEATQADITSVRTFVVALATSPHLVVRTDQPVPDRTPARLDLQLASAARVDVVGFPPGQAVRLFLFAVEADAERVFRRELPSVTTNNRGEGTLLLEVDPATGPGIYCVAFLEQLLDTDQLTNDPCYRPGAFYQELVIVSVTALRRGDTGAAVTVLQDLLRNGYAYTIEVDGQFGAGTEEAVRQFQAEHGLVVDGVAGPSTLNALGFPL